MVQVLQKNMNETQPPENNDLYRDRKSESSETDGRSSHSSELEDSSDDSIQSPIIDSPLKVESRKRHGSPNLNNMPNKLAKSGTSNENGSKRGLCDTLEKGIKKEVSKTFAALKREIAHLESDKEQLIKDKNIFKQQASDLVNKNAILTKEIADLKSQKKVMSCLECEKNMEQPTFCSNDCLQ